MEERYPLEDPSVAGGGENRVAKILKRYRSATQIRDNFKPLFQDVYDYCLPGRIGWDPNPAGVSLTDKIFDETAVVGIQEFASRLQAGLVPNFARWADLKTGVETDPEIKHEVDQHLDAVTDYVFEVINSSNFSQEVSESFLDLAVGTGCLLVEEGDAINPIRFNAVPLPHVVLDSGPDDQIDHIFRVRKMRYSDLFIMWPKAQLPPECIIEAEKEPDKKIEVLEATMRMREVRNEEAWKYCVILTSKKAMIFEQEFKGIGSCPWIIFRWAKAAGEIFGRGPALNALAAIKTCNLTIELILENAQISMAGIWQADDDGTINTDTVVLEPGVVIPRIPGGKGLEPLQAPGKFDVAELVLGDMRANIRKALYNETLGKPEGTPMSATEVAERMADLSRQIGSAFGRLQAEFVQPVLKRVIHILKKQGRINIPSVNGREIKVQAESPLARAQLQQDITQLSRYLELIGGVFGPQMLMMVVKGDKTAEYLAQKFGIPTDLIRSEVEKQQMAAGIAQLASQAQGAGMPEAGGEAPPAGGELLPQ